MDVSKFWSLIDSARQATEGSTSVRDDFLVNLEEALRDLEPAEILSFDQHFQEQFDRTWTWDVLGAALIIYGVDCDELDIDGFRAWLVSQGADFLDKAIKNVDLLGELDLVPEELYYYGLVNLASDVYEEMTAQELDRPLKDEREPDGSEFKLGDLPTRFPKLAEDFAFFVEQEDVEPEPETDEDDFDSLFEVKDEDNPVID